MATFPRLVNKQFNSPIGLYSQQNIQDTLSKHTEKLNNGATGIDFNNPITSKPANLANSAVLRMLEEEEARQRSGQPGRYTRGDNDPYVKRIDRMIDWPPKKTSENTEGQISMNNTYSAKFFAPKIAGVKRVAWPPPAEGTNGIDVERQSPPQRQAAPIKTSQSPAISRLIPFDIEPVSQAPPKSQVYSPVPRFSQPESPQYKQPYSPQPTKTLTPQSTTPTQIFPPPLPDNYATFPRKANSAFTPTSPKGFVPFDKAPQPFGPKTFAPVVSHVYEPVPAPNLSPISPQIQREYELLSPQPFSSNNPQILGTPRSEPTAPWAPSAVGHQLDQFVEPPPTTVVLRPTAPVHQMPAPVVISQPVAQKFKGGVNMRGDQKWPPQQVKEAVAAENEARILLAKGPACRPRKVKKDYTQFFAKNALPNNYPGYKVPPGTQHFQDTTGMSQF